MIARSDQPLKRKENALALPLQIAPRTKIDWTDKADKVYLKQHVRPPFFRCPDDGLDRPALPRLPSSDDATGAALYGDADHRRHPAWRQGSAARFRSIRTSRRAAARRLRTERSFGGCPDR